MRKLVATAILFTAMHTSAATPAYDEAADAKAEIQSTLVQAQRAKVPVLVVFGANWCGDCKVLDLAFKSGASAPLVQKSFKVVKVKSANSIETLTSQSLTACR